MLAAVFDAPRAIRVERRAAPEPGRGEALVRVAAAGLCAGDLYIFQGRNPYVTYPRVGGHEIAGTVAGLGPDTDGPPPGARVVVEPFIGCGRCYPCRVGKYNCCTRLSIIGVHREGGFAEFVTAPVAKLHAVPDGLPMLAASFAEPLAIGVHALRRAAVTADDTVLVLGAGPIGLAVIEAARAAGATVWASDIDPARLAVAVAFGAEPVAPDSVSARTDGEGVAVVVEATGSARVMEQATTLVAAGGRVVILGLATGEAEIRLPALDITRREVTLLGSRASADCFPEALSLLASGAIRTPGIATPLPLDTAPEVFAGLDTAHAAMHKAVFLSEDT